MSVAGGIHFQSAMPVAHDADSHVFQLGDGERVLGYSVSVPAAHHVDAQGRPSLRNVKRPLVYVHGFPTCRLESKMLRHAAPGLLARDGDDPTATATAVFDVCIAVDRPGVGLSTRYPRDPTLGDFGLELRSSSAPWAASCRDAPRCRRRPASRRRDALACAKGST